MPNINLAGGTHGTVVRFAGTADEERYEPYPAGRSLTILNHAIRIIQNNIYKKNVQCNSYFKHLPKGKTFDEIWEASTLWINYDPRVTNAFYGATNGSDTEITIYEDAFKRGHWWVVGTIVHELGHVGGAKGGLSIKAERALKFCGLSALYDPSAVGIYPSVKKDDDQRIA